MKLSKRDTDLLAIAGIIGWLLVCLLVADVVTTKDLGALSLVVGFFLGQWHGRAKCRLRYTAETDASIDKGCRG